MFGSYHKGFMKACRGTIITRHPISSQRTNPRIHPTKAPTMPNAPYWLCSAEELDVVAGAVVLLEPVLVPVLVPVPVVGVVAVVVVALVVPVAVEAPVFVGVTAPDTKNAHDQPWCAARNMIRSTHR